MFLIDNFLVFIAFKKIFACVCVQAIVFYIFLGHDIKMEMMMNDYCGDRNDYDSSMIRIDATETNKIRR